MGCRILDLTVINAGNLKDVNRISKMEAYVVVSLDGNPGCPQKSESPVDVDGGPNPTWSFNVKLYVDEPSTQQNRLTIHFKLRCNRVLGDKDIGEVVVPVKELLNSSAADGKASSVTYPVRMPSGKPKGELHFSYKFSNKLTAEAAAPGHLATPNADVAVMGYPVPAGPSGSYGAGYLPSPPGAYAPPPTPGYECPPPPVPPPPAGVRTASATGLPVLPEPAGATGSEDGIRGRTGERAADRRIGVLRIRCRRWILKYFRACFSDVKWVRRLI